MQCRVRSQASADELHRPAQGMSRHDFMVSQRAGAGVVVLVAFLFPSSFGPCWLLCKQLLRHNCGRAATNLCCGCTLVNSAIESQAERAHMRRRAPAVCALQVGNLERLSDLTDVMDDAQGAADDAKGA